MRHCRRPVGCPPRRNPARPTSRWQEITDHGQPIPMERTTGLRRWLLRGRCRNDWMGLKYPLLGIPHCRCHRSPSHHQARSATTDPVHVVRRTPDPRGSAKRGQCRRIPRPQPCRKAQPFRIGPVAIRSRRKAPIRSCRSRPQPRPGNPGPWHGPHRSCLAPRQCRRPRNGKPVRVRWKKRAQWWRSTSAESRSRSSHHRLNRRQHPGLPGSMPTAVFAPMSTATGTDREQPWPITPPSPG